MNLLKDRLITIRERRGLSQLKLADRSKVSRRQIARIETESDTARRGTTINRLATALSVDPRVLTGELPLPDHDDSRVLAGKEAKGDTETVSARVSPEVRLAYDLISTCFGISLSDVVRIAPLLLAVLAVGSFAWRKEKIERANELLDKLDELDGDVPQDSGQHSHRFHHFLHLGYEVGEVAACEERAIEERDLFGTHEKIEWGNGQAFCDYLRALASKTDCDDIVDAMDIAFDEWSHLPQSYKVCASTLSKMSGGSQDFIAALENLELRVQDIPKIFMADFPGVRLGIGIRDLVEEPALLRKKWFQGWKNGQHFEDVQLLLDWEREDEEMSREREQKILRGLAGRGTNHADT